MLPNTGLITKGKFHLPWTSNPWLTPPRHDLGSCAGDDDDSGSGKTTKEFMPQIMWPSLYLKGGIEDSEVHQRIIQFARQGLKIIQNQNM